MGWEQEQCLRYQWQQWFYEDIRYHYGDNPAVAHYLSENCYFSNVLDDSKESKETGKRIAKLLVTPVVESYRAAAQMVFEGKKVLDAQNVVRKKHQVHLPHIENALRYLCDEGFLSQDAEGRFLSGPQSDNAEQMRASFLLDKKQTKWMMPRGDA
jgi:hypothetical protein